MESYQTMSKDVKNVLVAVQTSSTAAEPGDGEIASERRVFNDSSHLRSWSCGAQVHCDR